MLEKGDILSAHILLYVPASDVRIVAYGVQIIMQCSAGEVPIIIMEGNVYVAVLGVLIHANYGSPA